MSIVQTYVNSLKKMYPDVPTEEIERIVIETIKEVTDDQKKHPPVVLDSYKKGPVANYLMKELNIGTYEARESVSNIFNEIDSMTKKEGYSLDEEGKGKFAMGILEAAKYFGRKINDLRQ